MRINTEKTSRSCLIISGGEFAPLPAGLRFDFCIACDRGFEYAERLGIRPDLIVGDFDSASHIPEGDIPVVRLPAMKDDTDTMSAVKTALDTGYTELHIVCAFGGRLDHTLANVQTAAYVTAHGGHCHMYGKEAELTVVKNGELRLPEKKHSYLSVFAIGGPCSGVSLSGTGYELSDACLTPDYPLGVSNEWAGPEAVITVKNGMLAVVICSKD